jgi:hypothetical protein
MSLFVFDFTVVADELMCNGWKKRVPEFRLVNCRSASLGAVD